MLGKKRKNLLLSTENKTYILTSRYVRHFLLHEETHQKPATWYNHSSQMIVDAEKTSRLIARGTVLTVLNLTFDVFQGDGSAEILASHVSMTALYLTHAAITDAEVKAFLGSTTLRFLDLSFTDIGDEALSSLDRNTTLTHLQIGHNRITDASISSLLTCDSLCTLHMETIPLTDIGFDRLLRHSTLTSLRAPNIGLLSSEAVRSIDQNTTLTQLWLSITDIGDEGARHLSRNTTLLSLTVTRCNVSTKGMHHLACNTVLTDLNVMYNCKIDSRGMEAFLSNETLFNFSFVCPSGWNWHDLLDGQERNRLAWQKRNETFVRMVIFLSRRWSFHPQCLTDRDVFSFASLLPEMCFWILQHLYRHASLSRLGRTSHQIRRKMINIFSRTGCDQRIVVLLRVMR